MIVEFQMNILSYIKKINYLLISFYCYLCAELKLLLFNAISGSFCFFLLLTVDDRCFCCVMKFYFSIS